MGSMILLPHLQCIIPRFLVNVRGGFGGQGTGLGTPGAGRPPPFPTRLRAGLSRGRKMVYSKSVFLDQDARQALPFMAGKGSADGRAVHLRAGRARSACSPGQPGEFAA